MEMESFIRGMVHDQELQDGTIPPMPFESGWQDRILGPLESVLASDPFEQVRSAAVAGFARILESSVGLEDADAARARVLRALETTAQTDASEVVRTKAAGALQKARAPK